MKTAEPTTSSALVALVRQAQQGDRAAMTALYEQTAPAIYRTIRALVRDPELALDVQQETYLRAFTSLGRLSDPEKLLPWLRRIAQNQAKDALQKKQPLLFSELEESTAPDVPDMTAGTSPELALEAAEHSAMVTEALACLGDGQRMILGMYYYEQLSVREIAAALGISQSTVKSQLHRGRRNLERELARRKEQGLQLYGVALFPGFLRLWRGTATKRGAAEVLRGVLSQLPVQAATLRTVSSAALLTRTLATLAIAAVLSGAAVGIGLAVQTLPQKDDAPQPEITDTDRPRMDAELPPIRKPGQSEETTPDEPELTADFEEPTIPDEPQQTETIPPATAPPEGEMPAGTGTADAGIAGAGDLEEIASAGDMTDQTPASLPTENPFPFQYQELTVPVGGTWCGSFATDEEWEVTVFAHTPNLTMTTNCFWSACENGVQTVTIELNEPGIYTWSLCRSNGNYAWTRWVRLTILPAEDAG